MAKKIVIPLEAKNEPDIYGVAANIKAYSLSWLLNQRFKINLAQGTSFIVSKANRKFEFEVFSQDTQEVADIKLIASKAGNKALHSKYKTIDFFIFIFSEKLKSTEFLKVVREEADIIAVFKLENDKYFNKIIEQL